jgi:adenosylmethionine-8-amino-7-oxononanoate aminotransferase
MVFAKGLASAYMPIAGLSVSDEIYDGITKANVPYPHVFTFGGHPVSCAVAAKHLEILERESLVERGAQMGLHLLGRLKTIQAESAHIGDVRGMGLDYGVELVANKATKEPFDPEQKVGMRIRALLLEKGIIVGGFGPNNITLGPPLIITKDEVDHVLDGLEWAIKKVVG